VKAVILARVSTIDHETENPLGQLREAAARRGLEVVEPPYVAGGGRRAARPTAGHEVETAKEPGRADFAETLSFLKRQRAVLLPTLAVD
jgi:DNA invertase Pin-like site-specific DNA recombinase